MKQSFLQSKYWESFRNSLGQKTFWIDNNLLVKVPLILGQSYLYCPRCVFKDKDSFNKFIKESRKIAQAEGIFFLRFEPQFVCDDIKLNKEMFKQVESRQPAQTLCIDLSKSLDEILANAKQKTRYNIKLAKKKGVKIYTSTDIKDLNKFYNLAEETANRDNIRFHDRTYYGNMIEILGKEGKIKFYFAKYKNKDIACAISVRYGNTFYYLHGASSNEYRNVMAPYLLQWQMIKDAKELGHKIYDFWGCAPLIQEVDKDGIKKFKIKDENHSWVGITKFKLGFAPTTLTGKYIEYPGCYEISYGKKRYLLYSMFKKVV